MDSTADTFSTKLKDLFEKKVIDAVAMKPKPKNMKPTTSSDDIAGLKDNQTIEDNTD